LTSTRFSHNLPSTSGFAKSNPIHRARPLRLALLGQIVMVTGVLTLSGCYGTPPKPVFPEGEEDRFSGLEITLDSAGPQHVLIVKTPTGGYQCAITYIADSFGGKDIYLLIREPNNLYVYSTTNHPARVASGVESSIPVRILALQAPHNAKLDREAYRLIRTTPTPAPTPASTPTTKP